MHREGLDWAARVGYAARGVVYLVIGGLAVLAAVGGGGQTSGSKGALQALAGAPWGAAVLVMIGIGLFGYALWRGLQSLFDADGHGHGRDAKGLAIRGGLLVSAVTHTLLGTYALSLVFAFGGGSGGGSGSQGAAAWLMQQPFGRYLVAAVALAIIGAGIAQFRKGFSRKFREHMKMSPALMAKLSPICTFGLAARGVVFLIIGGFFLYAAWTVDPGQAGGLDSALGWLRGQSYGGVLFLVVAAGLFAFGLYSLIEAGWRRVTPGGADGKVLTEG